MERLRFELDKMKGHLAEILIFAAVVSILSIGTYSRNGFWQDEIVLWQDCVKKSSNKARPYVNLGSAYVGAGAYDKALDMCYRAIRIDPRESFAYYTLSLAFQKIGDLDKAIAMGKKSQEVDPTLHLASYTLATIYFERGDYAESAESFKKFLKVYPNFPNVHHLLAVVYVAQKKFDKAVEEFEREVRIDPRHALAHKNLGQIYWYEFQDRKKAIFHLKIALFLDPFLPERAKMRKLVQQLEESS
jgi:protein O-mannosyl-transferase